MQKTSQSVRSAALASRGEGERERLVFCAKAVCGARRRKVEFQNQVLRFAVPLVFAVLVSSNSNLIAQTTASNRAGIRKDSQYILLPPPAPLPRLIVKFKPAPAQEIEAALSLPALELRPPSPRVRRWLDQHQLKTLRPLYATALKQKLESGRSDQQMAEMARNRFPQRAQRVRGSLEPPPILGTYLLEPLATSPAQLRAALERLRADPGIEFAQLDQVAQAQFTPNDPYFDSGGSWGQIYFDLYGLRKISCPEAWDTENGSGVIVAVVDTGIDYRHRDITNRIWINTGETPDNGEDDDHNGFVDDHRGWDFIGPTYRDPRPDNDPLDSVNGHGTHVAGTLAAQGNNNRGIIGVAWGARVMAVRALDDSGKGTDSALASAILYAADNGADVINASWGGKGTSPVIEDAVNYATALGVVFVAAAGNATVGNDPGDIAEFYPANIPAAIVVSALQYDDTRARFSNFGQRMDVAAPGADILSLRARDTHLGSALDEEYTRTDGTSTAAPHVAGTAALLLSHQNDYSPEEIRQVLRLSADDVWPTGFDPYSGYGRINASKALEFGPVLEARIVRPASGTVAGPLVTIAGVARGDDFEAYTLDYGAGDEPAAWTVLTQSNETADNETLGALPTFGLPDGRYTIRLRAFNEDNDVFEDRLQINVDYTFLTSPARPPVPSVAAVHKPGVTVEINGTVRAPDFQGFHVEWARGFNANFGYTHSGITLASGGAKPVTNGLLATWDSSVFNRADYVTFRLLMHTPAFTNEARGMVYIEPDLYSTNWPRWLDQAPPYGSSVLLARDGSGRNLLTLANSDNVSTTLPSRLWRFSLDGSSVVTFPLDHSYLQPAAANLDSLPGDETVVAERHDIRVFRPDGSSFIPVLPLSSRFQFALPSLADLDGDGAAEILAWGSGPPDLSAWLYAWKSDGQLFNTNYPVGPLPNDGFIPPNRLLAVDVDADGKPELLVMAGDSPDSFSLRLFRADGQPAHWPTQSFTAIFWQLAAGDLDGDGLPEIVLAYSEGSGTNLVQVFSADGSIRPGWPVRLDGETPMRVIVADLDRDGRSEIIATAKATLDVLREDGTHFPTLWPVIGSGFQSYGSPVAGDIDGDGIAEILVTRENVVSAGSNPSYRSPGLIAYQTNGQIARSWRLLGANGNQPNGDGNVVFGDFDGDGQVNLAVNYPLISGGGTSGELNEGVLLVLALNAPFRPHPRDWPMNFHDARNSAAGLVPVKLQVREKGSDLVVSWPRQPDAVMLQASDDPHHADWNTLSTPVSSSNGTDTVVLQRTNASRWYRLQYQ